MGQKVNPHILRLGTLYNWESRWFDKKNYKEILLSVGVSSCVNSIVTLSCAGFGYAFTFIAASVSCVV